MLKFTAPNRKYRRSVAGVGCAQCGRTIPSNDIVLAVTENVTVHLDNECANILIQQYIDQGETVDAAAE